MKKLLLISLVCMGIAYNAHAITWASWTKQIDGAQTLADLEKIGKSSVSGVPKDQSVEAYYNAALLRVSAGVATPPKKTPPPVTVDKRTITTQVNEVAKLLKDVQDQLRSQKWDDLVGQLATAATTK